MTKKIFMLVILFAGINFTDYAFSEPRPMKARQAAFPLEFKVYRTNDMPANWFKTYDGFYVTRRIDNNWVYGRQTVDGMKMTDILVGTVDPSSMPELNEAYTYVPPGMTLPEQTTTVQTPNETPQRVEAPIRLRTRDPYELAKIGTPEELRAAVNLGVNFKVERAVEDEINAEFGNGETPLHYAAYYNRNPESIRFLIEQGLDVNAGFYSGNAFWGDVLSLAVISRNINAIYELLRHGANQNSWSNIMIGDDYYAYSGSPLHIIAAQYKDDYSVTKSLIEAIINAGGNVNYHEAIDADDKEFLKDTSLLPRSEWTSQNPIDNIEYYSNMGLCMFRPSFTPLMFAVLYDNPDAVDILLDCKADANIRSGEGKNALDYANELPPNSAIKRSDVFNRLRAATRR